MSPSCAHEEFRDRPRRKPGEVVSGCGFRKCYYQLADCENWSDEGLTLGIGHAWIGPPGPDGRSTLAAYDAPICRSCLNANPVPLDPGPYYGDPRDNPDAIPIPVPHISG